MSRRPRGVLEYYDDASSRATSLEMTPLAAPVRPPDRTLRVGTGYRMTATVEGFRLTAGRQRVTVRDGLASIGSAEGNTLVIADDAASRFHCDVRIEDQRALVRDLGSTNGTFIDGVRVKEGYLKTGSTLMVGRTEVRFEGEGERHFVAVSDAPAFGELVGPSPAMRRVFSVLEKAARTDTTLIIEGETGTGKTRAAAALHALSPRAKKPFLVVDCGALPPSLLEAELFGHEKGAFTGATARRLGIFEEADGGTVLLDEVGELPLELQPRLLRVLEERSVKRLGQNRFTPVDVRIVAATHRDLRGGVNAGTFRADLYFRLAVVRVTVPPLRERLEDVPAVARAVLEQLGATERQHPRLFEDAFFESLARSPWPGNVRELRNHLERCLLFDEPVPVGDSDAPVPQGKLPASWANVSLGAARQAVVEQFEREYLKQLLERHHGNVTRAAGEAQVDRVYIHRLLRRYGVKATK